MVGTFLFVAFIWFVVSKRRRRNRWLGRWRDNEGLDGWHGRVQQRLGEVEEQVQKQLGRVDRGGWLDTYRGGARVAQKRQAHLRGDSSSPDAPLAPAAETPMDALQRRYVADEITVEEYERQLDELLRKK